MKKTFLLGYFLLLISTAFSQGITFESTIEAAFQKAKASGKMVFVECYSPHCPICMGLEPTLKNAEVGKFYNQNFVNYKLNVEDAKQVAFLNKKKIFLPGFPLFFFFDSNQNLLHSTDPINTPKDLIKQAQTALDPNQQVAGFWKKYQAGDRDINMMVSLAYFLRIKQDTIRNKQVANDLYSVYPKNQLGDKTSWAIMKKCIMDLYNGFSQFWLNNIAIGAKYEADEGHPGQEGNALGRLLQLEIFSPQANTYSLAKVKQLKQYMNLLGVGQYATANTWQIECPALLREQGKDVAFNFLKGLIKAQTQPQLLVYYVTFYNNTFPDGQFAPEVRSWLSSARPQLKSEQEIANLNYESARLYKKSGDLANAKKDLAAAQTSIIAAKAKVTDPNLKNVVVSIENNINKLAGELK
ncbi:thioredoxin domaiN-containing protein [Emticicia oligotrophica DSM 17448]|uniref:Thioredoxin domaiN-containing protein n=1 Tax=Emticicia oligotrophica (strain DSM 17448 / CIP 109782 / MTCC 6937 / GPTSA100-15) TaxID=929562 RepID=A0ABM5N0D0_EMTOG|nr:thioredoxin family protein [Emticicia oligotrophica]AFK02914.1 thioredoxin domaiN-containing protein [Emticicia oligotrophica DSM 17448]